MRSLNPTRIAILLTLIGAVANAQGVLRKPVPAPMRHAPAPAAQTQHSAATQPAHTAAAPIYRPAPTQPTVQASAQPAPAPIPQRPLAQIERRTNPGSVVKGEHLPGWINQHSNLTPAQQQQALEREPGFHDLPQITQQRMRERLSQLSAMPPAKRQQLVERNEQMEKLSPDQRSQVRGATQQFTMLPPDERKAVARAFHQIRQLPPDQRAAAVASGRFSGQFNEAQRSSLNNLVRVEPLMAPILSADSTPR